jgi:diamine N-acetyltransferase
MHSHTTSTDLLIRLVMPEEINELRHFGEYTFREAWQSTNDADNMELYCQKTFSLAQTKAEYQHPHSEFYFAFLDAELAGYMKLNFEDHPSALRPARTVQVERLYVNPNMQSQGIGTHLLDFSARRANETNAPWIWLTVWQKADRARRFYEKHGFEVFGESPFQLGKEAQTDWMMKKAI